VDLYRHRTIFTNRVTSAFQFWDDPSGCLVPAIWITTVVHQSGCRTVAVLLNGYGDQTKQLNVERVWPRLVSKKNQDSPSHRMFEHMHGTLNVDEKN
jgi:hypothetical protein